MVNSYYPHSVCTTWHVKHTGEVFLIHVFRKKLEYPQLFKACKQLIEKYQPDVILIEASPAGRPLIQSLLEYKVLLSRVFPITPITDKLTRLYTHTFVLELGLVRVDSTATWLEDFRKELTRFPKSKYDDQVDSVSQFLYFYHSWLGTPRWGIKVLTHNIHGQSLLNEDFSL